MKVFDYPLVPDFRERLRAGQTEAAPPVVRPWEWAG